MDGPYLDCRLYAKRHFSFTLKSLNFDDDDDAVRIIMAACNFVEFLFFKFLEGIICL